MTLPLAGLCFLFWQVFKMCSVPLGIGGFSEAAWFPASAFVHCGFLLEKVDATERLLPLPVSVCPLHWYLCVLPSLTLCAP